MLRTLGFPNAELRNISFFPDGSRVALTGVGGVRVVDAQRLTTVETLDIGGGGRVAFARGGAKAYCPIGTRNAVAVFDLNAKNCVAAPASLVAWWPGDGTAEDARGFGPDAAEPGMAFAPGLVGRAFKLDGSDHPLVLSPPAWGGSTEEMTIAAWVKFTDDPSNQTAMDLVSFGKGWRVSLDSESRLHLGSVGFSGAPGHTRLASGVWTQIAVSKDPRRVALYLNGALETAIAAADLPPAYGVKLRVGIRGLVDEIQWFNRALTQDDLQSIVKAGSAGLCY